jgi:hypothetical protein
MDGYARRLGARDDFVGDQPTALGGDARRALRTGVGAGLRERRRAPRQ